MPVGTITIPEHSEGLLLYTPSKDAPRKRPVTLPPMNWLDILIGVVLIASMIGAYRNGLSREVVRLAALIAGVVGGLWYYGPLSVLLQPYIDNRRVAEFAAFMLFLVGSLIAGAVIAWALGKLMGWTGLRWFDRLLGAAFGVMRGLLVSAVIVLGVIAFTPFPSSEEEVAESRLAPFVLHTAQMVADFAAPRAFEEDFTEGFARVRDAWIEGVPEAQVRQ